MKNLVLKIIFFGLVTISGTTFSEETILQLIGPVNYNGSTNTAFFRGNLKWGPASCPNATYVQVLSNVSGRKEILSIALAAKMAGKRAQFWGTCNADGDYFDAMYIVVE